MLRSWLFPGSIPTLHITRNRTFRAAAFAPLFVLSRREPFEEPGATSPGVDPGKIGGEIHQFSEKFQGMSIEKSPYSDCCTSLVRGSMAPRRDENLTKICFSYRVQKCSSKIFWWRNMAKPVRLLLYELTSTLSAPESWGPNTGCVRSSKV